MIGEVAAGGCRRDRARRDRQAGLRGRQWKGFKSRRQVPIGPCVAGFAGLEKEKMVEVYGEHHALQRARDSPTHLPPVVGGK